MTETSAVPAFLDALEVILGARPGLADVQIATAHPGANLKAENIVVDRVETTQEWGPVGRKAREEMITAFLIMHITKKGAGAENAKAARTRIYELKGEVEAAFRSDPKVGDTVRESEISASELRQGAGDKTRWAEMELQVRCKQRI